MMTKKTNSEDYLVLIFLGLVPILIYGIAIILDGKGADLGIILVAPLYWGIIFHKFEAWTKLVNEVEQGRGRIATLEWQYSQYKEEKESNPPIVSYSIAQEILEYNDKKQLIKKRIFTAGEPVPETTVFEYDDHGRCVEEVCTEMEEDLIDDGSKLSETRTKYEYDEAGRLVRETSFMYGDSDVTIYKHDTNNRVVEILYPGREESISRIAHEYSSSGKLVKLVRYGRKNQGGKEINSEEYSYDDRGYCIEEIHHSFSRYARDSRITILRDAEGNETERCYFTDGKDLTEKTISKYDSNGNLVEQLVWGKGGKLISRSLFEYDVSNRLTLKVEEEPSIMKEKDAIITFIQYREKTTDIQGPIATYDIPVTVLPKPEKNQYSTEQKDEDEDEDDFKQ